MFLFPQFILLLVLMTDLTSAFGIGGHPIADSVRGSHYVDLSRSKDIKPTLSPLDRPFKLMNTVPGTKSRTGIRLNAVIDIVGVSPEPIHSAFAFATFGPQPFWLLMILLPAQEITKKTMGKMGKISLHCIV